MSKILNDAMIELEKIFVLNSRNVITDKAAINQIGNSVMRARQLSNLLTAGADDAVLLDTYATVTLPGEIASSGAAGPTNPAEPLGGIIIYQNGQDTAGARLQIAETNGAILSGYVADTKITDLLGDSLKRVKTINANVKNPTENEVSLGLIEVNTPFLALPVRNVLPISLFCNSIPTIEMSRAVPSVSVRVISPVAAVDNDGSSKSLSIGTVLGGPSEKILPGTAEHDIATATRGVRLPYGVVSPKGTSTAVPEDKNKVQQSVFGMEMFTMPQTLLNANRNVGNRGTPILDKFRPLMSLNSVSISIVPAGQAAFAYKEATISITIHDRSRMQDVAQLLRPDQFGFNYIEIEYGWVHPEDPGTRNPYAPLINAFRQRELYTVVSSSISMGDGGSVSVLIRCSLKGARDLLKMSPISDQWASTTQAEEIFQHMSKTITEIMKEDSYTAEDIRYAETLRSISATGSSGRFAISAEEMTVIKEALAKLKSSGDKNLTELREDLVEAFGEDGNGGEYKKVVDKASEVFEAKITAMTKSKELYEFGKQKTGKAEVDDSTVQPSDSTQTRKYVTFGKMIATMLGSPLTTGNFAEVQLYFYTFNSDAGAVNRRNIAEFPIPFTSIRTAFAEPIKTDPKMPLSKMLRILISLVNDSSALAYGIQQPPKLEPEKTESDADIKKRKETNSSSMTLYKCKSTSFSKPIIEYKMDSIRIGDKPVLRIHFFDKRCTPNDEALYLLDASLSGGGSVELNSLVGALQQGDVGNFTTVLQQAEAAKIVNVSTVKDKKTYTLNTNNRALKSFIKRTVPYLSYGTPTSMMQTFSLQSIEMADFETALLMQAANGSRIPGQQFLDSPQNDMQIFPMNVSVSMLGCPLIEYAQEFFIDLDTGTSLDNIYVVNGVRHEISPGTFKTDLELKLTRSTGAGSAIDTKIRNLLKTIDSKQTGSPPAP